MSRGMRLHDAINLVSATSRRQSFVRFVNKTNRRVDVIWINYEGQRTKYRTIGPDEFCDVNTYVSHPWVFRDSVTHAVLVASFQEVYHPQDWLQTLIAGGYRPTGQVIQPIRKVVNITLPMYTLKERCMDVIRKHLSRVEDINTLEIPRLLKEEIVRPFT